MNLTLETTRLMGLDLSTPSPHMIAEELRAGLPVGAVDFLAKLIAPKDATFKYRIVPKATLARRKRSPSGRLTLDESERLARYASIWSLAMEVWKDEEKARRFLWSPHMLLRGQRAIDAADTAIGASEVERIIGSLLYGTAV